MAQVMIKPRLKNIHCPCRNNSIPQPFPFRTNPASKLELHHVQAIYLFLNSLKINRLRPYSDFFTVTPGKVTTRGHNFKIMLTKCRLDLSKYSFSNRCVNCWSSLSSDVVNSSSVNIFMTKLKKCDLREYLMGRTLGI